MARVFITGSSEGLGLLAGRLLTEWGHRVTLHARNEARAADARRALPEAEGVVIGDVSSIAAMRQVAEQANASGRFEAVIHNVGIGSRDPSRSDTADGLSPLFAVNVLAPYLLTALITRPDRLVYLSSGMHQSGNARMDEPKRRWNGSYSDSKLCDVLLAFGVARRWPKVLSNALNPGWVPTRMGGRGAPDDLTLGATTQTWLAVSDDPEAKLTGQYFFHQKRHRAAAAAQDTELQDRLLDYCAKLTGRPLSAP